jgi:Tfp pilus assembly protein PilN
LTRRHLRAEVDAEFLTAALAACAHAGVEVVGIEPESLPLARVLAVSSPDISTGPGIAVVWHTPSRAVVVRSCGDLVELVGEVALDPTTGPAAVAAEVGALLAGADVAEVVIASASGDVATMVLEIAVASGLRARVGDPLARIRASGEMSLGSGIAAGAIGLQLEVRGLPRVEIPVRRVRTGGRAGKGTPEPEAAVSPATAEEAPVAEQGTRRAGSRRVVLAVAGSIVIAAVAVGWALSDRAAVRDRQAVLGTLNTQLAAIPSPTAPTRTLLTLGADRRARVDAIAAVLGSRVAWDRILREVSAVLPDNVWLSELTTTGAGLSGGLRLRGYATRQQAVAATLARLGIVADLSNVRLERSQSARLQGRPVVRFSIVTSVRSEPA